MPLYRAPNAALPCTKCRFTVHQMPLYRAPNAALPCTKCRFTKPKNGDFKPFSAFFFPISILSIFKYLF